MFLANIKKYFLYIKGFLHLETLLPVCETELHRKCVTHYFQDQEM